MDYLDIQITAELEMMLRELEKKSPDLTRAQIIEAAIYEYYNQKKLEKSKDN